MKFTIKTVKLQEMVSRAVKGAGNNKLIPLTSLMAIELKNGKLTLITTNASDYLYIMQDKIEGEDFYVTIQVETFSKLISRLTCENVTLELTSSGLTVSGNGKYTIEVPMDEEGEIIKYPDPVAGIKLKAQDEISFADIQSILNTVKPSLATTMEIPCYTGYYMADKVVATDTYKICRLSSKMFNTPALISPEMMNLLSVMTAEKISVMRKNDIFIFFTPDCIIQGPVLEGIDEYAIDAISGLLDSEFTSMCKVSKQALLQTLDRLILFVNKYDNDTINLTFTNEGLQISSKAASGVEIIKYTESKDFQDFTCMINIEMFTSQIKAQGGDIVEIYYGQDTAIKMVDGSVTQIISLLDDNVSEE